MKLGDRWDLLGFKNILFKNIGELNAITSN